MQISLTRYWFEFEANEKDWQANMGCGVTAYNYDDAINLLGKYQFKGESIPPIAKVIDNIDISTLDPNHVLPI